jgi:hypothetical protein
MPRTIIINAELRPIAVKVSKIIHAIPKLDGHFWVMRDGKIIDPHFKEYDFIKSVHNGKKFIYQPADAMTQRMMIAIHHKVVKQDYATISEFVADYVKISGEEPVCAFCLFNALMEIEKNGGELVFGSWGIERKDGSKFWEFGGEDWTGVSAFFKDRTFKGMVL